MRDLLSGLVDIELQPQDDVPLTRQLYERLQGAILAGSLPSGHRLPSSRDLARHLKVSRNTVSFVIDQLTMEGYLDVSRGRRPIVAVLPDTPLVLGKAAVPKAPARFASHWAEKLRGADWPIMDEGWPRPFLPGFADAREFPHDIWARCLRRAARAQPHPTTTLNRPALQEVLLQHLVLHRGVRAEARQIIITPTAQAAIELMARLTLNAGDLAWLESPGYGGARVAFEAAGARLRGVTLDPSGMSFAGRTDRPRLIFVTPSHQYPTGRLMPVTRRQELLSVATSVNAVIIEDDYDSEFHYDGRPVAALQGLDRNGHVFYVGTFSKATYAGIRAGYAIVPENLVDVFERAQRHTGQIVATALQDALAEFIGESHFAAHIRKMTRIYRTRRDRLVQALDAAAGDRLKTVPPAGGMQLLAYLRPQDDDRAITTRLANAGATVRPLSGHFIGERTEPGLFLGFAAWNESEIDAGADIIGQMIRKQH